MLPSDSHVPTDGLPAFNACFTAFERIAPPPGGTRGRRQAPLYDPAPRSAFAFHGADGDATQLHVRLLEAHVDRLLRQAVARGVERGAEAFEALRFETHDQRADRLA